MADKFFGTMTSVENGVIITNFKLCSIEWDYHGTSPGCHIKITSDDDGKQVIDIFTKQTLFVLPEPVMLTNCKCELTYKCVGGIRVEMYFHGWKLV